MSSALLIVAIVAAGLLVSIFGYLQWLSNRKYKPGKQDIAAILQACIMGTLSNEALDEFMCVKISYDHRLDRIRMRFNEIMADKKNLEDIQSIDVSGMLLNNDGKRQVESLLSEFG